MEKTLNYLLCVLAISMIILMYIECVTEMNIYDNYTFCGGVFIIVLLVTYPIRAYYILNNNKESNDDQKKNNLSNSIMSLNNSNLINQTNELSNLNISNNVSNIQKNNNVELPGLDCQEKPYYTVIEHKTLESDWKNYQ